MEDSHESRLRLAAARADFLDSGDAAGVPDVVAASWRRSQDAGVDHDHYRVDYHDNIDTDSRLIRCATPILKRLELDMNDVPVTIALADAQARVVVRRDCSPAVGRLLDRVDFSPGYGFEEHSIGTNGVGTVFEARMAISVVGSAHFNETLTPFACTGAPVIDPISGKFEGVLDVSLLADTWNPLIHALVRAAATDIGRNLMLDRTKAQQALFSSYLHADTRSRHAVVAIGDSVMMNRRAQSLLSTSDSALLQQHARFLMTRPHVDRDVLVLPDGRELQLRVVRVPSAESEHGIVLLVSEQHEPSVEDAVEPRTPANQPAAIRSGDGTVTPATRTHAWNQAWTTVHEAAATATPIVLIGEPDVGKTSLIGDAMRHSNPRGSVANLDFAVNQQAVADKIIETVDREPALLLLRNLDHLDQYSLPAVAKLLDGCGTDVWVAATIAQLPDPVHPAHGLLARFDRSVAVPAVRHRSEDIAALVEAAMRQAAPTRRLRLSPRARQVLAAYSWPGNLRQLHEVVRHIVTRRPVGEVQVEDLPGFCRSHGTANLTALEIAERDAIVTALQEQSGNRVHAAAALGMSRSSLYRKIKHYGLRDL